MRNHHQQHRGQKRRWRGEKEMGQQIEVIPWRFFKLILPAILHEERMRVPQNFTQKFGNEIPAMVALIVPTGDTWDLGVIRDENKLWFSQGWESFAEFYSLSVGNFLLFEYRTGSYFTINVFDIMGCEIIYPSRAPQPHEVNQIYHLISDDEEEMLDSDSVECLDSMLTDSDRDLLKQQFTSNREHVIDPDYVVYLEMACSFTAPPHCPMGSNEFSNSMRHDSPIIEGNRGQSLGTMKAMKAARRLKIKNPHFIIEMRKHNVTYLYLARDFSMEFLRSDMRTFKLRCNGKEWHTECSYMSGICLVKGWSTFWHENKLKVGDVCIFELLNEEDTVLKVTIFR